MGAAPDQLDAIADLFKRGLVPAGSAIADIGCQQLWDANADDVTRFFGEFSLRPDDDETTRLASRGTFIAEHLKRAGFRYRSFDIVQAPDCTYFDLNIDRVPRRWRGKFDLVLNFGTTEHVLNQLNAFRALHDFAKPGGLIYSYFIRGGHMEHGLLHYSDRFIDLLCAANGYGTIWRRDHKVPGHECTWMVLRKTTEREFATPIDVQEGGAFLR